MSDLETLKAMFDRAGVIYKFRGGEYPDYVATDETHMSVEAHDGPANEGYDGFVAAFEFDKEGKLLSVGAWE